MSRPNPFLELFFHPTLSNKDELYSIFIFSCFTCPFNIYDDDIPYLKIFYGRLYYYYCSFMVTVNYGLCNLGIYAFFFIYFILFYFIYKKRKKTKRQNNIIMVLLLFFACEKTWVDPLLDQPRISCYHQNIFNA